MLQPISITQVKSYRSDNENPVQIIYTEDEISASLELLKVLHTCNQKHGWTLLIAPDNVPNKMMLQSCSIDSSKLLVIRQKHLVNLPYVLNSALHNGNFAAVITWTDILKPSELETLHISPSNKTQLYCFSREAQQEELKPLIMC
ncbi:SulA-like leucine-rich domain-containing protein [Pseudoalteromonas xiamenensis]